jgi:hypothetical protein
VEGDETIAEPEPAQNKKRKRDQGQNPGRSTICISSQVGCAVDCQFCLTALLGVKRNLTAGEIVGQVCAVLKDQQVFPPEDRINLVFMGQGEAIFRPQSQVGKGYSRCDNTYGARSLRAWRTAAKRVLSTLRKVRKASLSAMNDSGRIHSS